MRKSVEVIIRYTLFLYLNKFEELLSKHLTNTH